VQRADYGGLTGCIIGFSFAGRTPCHELCVLIGRELGGRVSACPGGVDECLEHVASQMDIPILWFRDTRVR
jgi:hypothetical protein